MITVSILINGDPIFTRSARRQEDKRSDNTYKTDAGDVVEHHHKDGAIALAKKLLDTIKEDM